MGLTIRRVEFRNFRNYVHFELDGLGPLTVFVGPNAVGKTNVIEGIQLLTAQTSFRNPTAAQLVRDGAEFARLDAWLGDGSRELVSTLQIVEGKKRRLLNGKPKSAAAMRGSLPAVAFTPEDLELARSASSPRRAALDALGVQLSANHQRICLDYEKTLRSKNRLLKDEADPSMLAALNEVMVTVGAQLTCYRNALFLRLSEQMARYYADISGGREQLRGGYTPSWMSYDPAAPVQQPVSRDDARRFMQQALDERAAEERARRRSVVGPHADHLDFFIDGKNAAAFGSQGQKRALVLSFKLAETALVESMLNQKPVLLLDDVMGELDAARREALVEFVLQGTQTFVTTTDLQYFKPHLLETARIVKLPLGEE